MRMTSAAAAFTVIVCLSVVPLAADEKENPAAGTQQRDAVMQQLGKLLDREWKRFSCAHRIG